MYPARNDGHFLGENQCRNSAARTGRSPPSVCQGAAAGRPPVRSRPYRPAILPGMPGQAIASTLIFLYACHPLTDRRQLFRADSGRISNAPGGTNDDFAILAHRTRPRGRTASGSGAIPIVLSQVAADGKPLIVRRNRGGLGGHHPSGIPGVCCANSWLGKKWNKAHSGTNRLEPCPEDAPAAAGVV